MGWLDKILGRTKSTAGEAVDSPAMREEGRSQEAAAHAEERAEKHEEMAQEERDRAATERTDEERLS
jgi:uncharacterized protein YjbJ (UPF0337 family)